MEEFQKYDWPGNVRQLQSIIQRGMILCQKDFLSPEDCEWTEGDRPAGIKKQDAEQMLFEAALLFLKRGGAAVYKEAVSAFERHLVKRALKMHNDNQVMTARFLGISRNTLREKIDKSQDPDLPKK
jgi:DNA-binding NtrC family response regulator